MSNCIVAQSGGPTSVINATVAGVVKANQLNSVYEHVYGGLNGIEGILAERFVDLTNMTDEENRTLQQTPSSALGSCRYKLKRDNPEDFEKIFRPELEAGRDILYVGFSSAMSCTYNSGCTVAAELREEFPEAKILTVDSLAATFSLGLLAIMAAMKKEEGATIEETAKYVEENVPNMAHAFTVDDLFHIMRGGRVSRSTAFIGSILSIKPILRVGNNGLIESAGKARGTKKAFQFLLDQIRENLTDPPLPFFVGHGDNEEAANEFAEMLKRELGLTDVHVCCLGPVCGCHGGPGLVGAFYHGKTREPGVAANKDEERNIA